MTKIALFAAAQVVMYLLTAYIAWDLAWVVSLGEETVDMRAGVVTLWCILSVAVGLLVFGPPY